jgi:Tol biopolymer transport system component
MKPGERELRGWPNGISSDGKTLYYNRYSGAADVGQILTARNLESGQEREIMRGSGIFAMSHDGEKIAVAHADGKDLVVDVLPSTRGPKREVYRAPGFEGAEIAWMPDGRYLILGPFGKQGHAKGFMRVSVETGESQPVGISASLDREVQFPQGFGAVRVSPNGRQLDYVAIGANGSGGEVWVLENFLPKAAK